MRRIGVVLLRKDGEIPPAKNGPALGGYGAVAMKDALTATMTTMPAELVRSLTWDRGAEMAAHKHFTIATDMVALELQDPSYATPAFINATGNVTALPVGYQALGLLTEDGISFGGHVNFWSEESWGFYINRIAGSFRTATGKLGVHHVDDALFAVIFKN